MQLASGCGHLGADPGILKGRGPAAISSKTGGGGSNHLLEEICIRNNHLLGL